MRKLIQALQITTGLLTGCLPVDTVYGPHRTPHEDFLAVHSYFVGKTIQRLRGRGWDHSLLQTITLPNGNLEDKYDGRFWKDLGPCWVYYEYNPQTEIIANWRFEGAEKDCVWQR